MANPVLQVPLGNIVSVPNMRLPKQGAQALSIDVDLTKNTALDGSFQEAFESGMFDFPQSVFIDNSGNPNAFTLTFTGVPPAGQQIIAAAGTQGFYPISPAMGDPNFTVATAGGVKVPVIFYNVPLPYFVWNTAPVGSPAGGAFVARDGNVAVGGTSQVLAAANPARKQIVIENPLTAAGQGIAAAESLYINFTGAAGVDNGTSIELLPGGSYISGSPVSTQQITVNATTNGHVYIAKEM